MKNALNSVKVAAPATNSFNLSHDVKLSGNMGNLMPVLAMEVIPGDRVRLGCENLIRLAPMLAPLMHRVDVRVEYFFVPNRIIWENWETWISNGGSSTPLVDPLPAHPTFTYSEGGTGKQYSTTPLLDYMGLPDPNESGPNPSVDETVSALPFGAYLKIYNDYYRDENLIAYQSDIGNGAYVLEDGDNSGNGSLFVLRKRAWEADYFTKALPFAQKGGEVDLPLGDVVLTSDLGGSGKIRVAATHALSGGTVDGLAVAPAAGVMLDDSVASGGVAAVYDPDGTLETSPTTINDLRMAIRLQEWLEKNARGGTRYSELIRSHFNVRPEDARLQRPEYIVGIKNPIQISEVLQTSETDSGTPQGTMAGHGVSYNQGNYGKYFCTEHGYVIGILSVMPKTAYQQGIPRHFLKFTDPTQIAWPTFANLGEQEILTREIMAFQGATGGVTWGYMPRYMEYKNLPSRVAGDFRTTLNFWHMGRIFGTPPLLNADFVEADPTHRVFAVDDVEEDKLWCQLMHHINVVRALPVYGTPTF